MLHVIDSKVNSHDDLADCRAELAESGWALIDPSRVAGDAASVLRRFGGLMTQYNGSETFEVTYKPGFDDVPYSQSLNGIGAHTEAPAEPVPPKYLALHCHRQARCGGGATQMADGIRFFEEALDPGLRAWALANPVDFAAAARPGSERRQVLKAPILSRAGGDPVLRFSYNLFRYGDVNPTASAVSDGGAGGALAEIAEAGEAYFARNTVSVLIPEGAVLIWDNHRLLHGRGQFKDPARHLTRYWLAS